RYAGEMLSRWSSQNTRITSRASTSTAERRRPISFAKVIFTAWYALHADLSDSAASIDTAWTGCSIGANVYVTMSSVRASLTPATVKGGAKKAATLLPSRRD